MMKAELDTFLNATDEEARNVVDEINSFKQVRTMHQPVENLTTESCYGFTAIMQRERLGLDATA